MTLVERFIEFDHWSTSRKTAFLSGLLVGLHGFATPVSRYLVKQAPDLVDIGLLDAIVWPWLGSIVACFVVSFLVQRSGLKGGMTKWLLIVPYALFLAYLIYVFGPASTALTAWMAMCGLIVLMVYGVRTGVVTALYGFGVLGLLSWWQPASAQRYAPALLDRSLDAQHNVLLTGGIFFVVIQTFVACFGILALLMSAKQLYETRLERSRSLIRRYIPSQLADKIIKGEHGEASKPERTKLTVFFSDLVGFTDIAEQMEPEDLSRVLNEYFAEMTTIAHRYGGTIDEIAGDAILIFFGAPNATNDKDHALRAARMATEMQSTMAKLNGKWRAAGIDEELRVRMGINTGVVTIGTFGSPDRMKYAALGKHVNLAARLQAQCEPGQILVSQATWLLINDQLACVEKGGVQLKGFRKPVMIYELANQP